MHPNRIYFSVSAYSWHNWTAISLAALLQPSAWANSSACASAAQAVSASSLAPWLEEAHIQVMRLLARVGRRSEALVQYHLCRRLLASELGVQPAAATNDLYRRIRDGIQAC